jgi:Ca2+-binding EF-hand superfamily protein
MQSSDGHMAGGLDPAYSLGGTAGDTAYSAGDTAGCVEDESLVLFHRMEGSEAGAVTKTELAERMDVDDENGEALVEAVHLAVHGFIPREEVMVTGASGESQVVRPGVLTEEEMQQVFADPMGDSTLRVTPAMAERYTAMFQVIDDKDTGSIPLKQLAEVIGVEPEEEEAFYAALADRPMINLSDFILLLRQAELSRAAFGLLDALADVNDPVGESGARLSAAMVQRSQQTQPGRLTPNIQLTDGRSLPEFVSSRRTGNVAEKAWRMTLTDSAFRPMDTTDDDISRQVNAVEAHELDELWEETGPGDDDTVDIEDLRTTLLSAHADDRLVMTDADFLNALMQLSHGASDTGRVTRSQFDHAFVACVTSSVMPRRQAPTTSPSINSPANRRGSVANIVGGALVPRMALRRGSVMPGADDARRGSVAAGRRTSLAAALHHRGSVAAGPPGGLLIVPGGGVARKASLPVAVDASAAARRGSMPTKSDGVPRRSSLAPPPSQFTRAQSDRAKVNTGSSFRRGSYATNLAAKIASQSRFGGKKASVEQQEKSDHSGTDDDDTTTNGLLGSPKAAKRTNSSAPSPVAVARALPANISRQISDSFEVDPTPGSPIARAVSKLNRAMRPTAVPDHSHSFNTYPRVAGGIPRPLVEHRITEDVKRGAISLEQTIEARAVLSQSTNGLVSPALFDEVCQATTTSVAYKRGPVTDGALPSLFAEQFRLASLDGETITQDQMVAICRYFGVSPTQDMLNTYVDDGKVTRSAFARFATGLGGGRRASQLGVPPSPGPKQLSLKNAFGSLKASFKQSSFKAAPAPGPGQLQLLDEVDEGGPSVETPRYLVSTIRESSVVVVKTPPLPRARLLFNVGPQPVAAAPPAQPKSTFAVMPVKHVAASPFSGETSSTVLYGSPVNLETLVGLFYKHDADHDDLIPQAGLAALADDVAASDLVVPERSLNALRHATPPLDFQTLVNITSQGAVDSTNLTGLKKAFDTFPRGTSGVSVALMRSYLLTAVDTHGLTQDEMDACLSMIDRRGKKQMTFTEYVDMCRRLNLLHGRALRYVRRDTDTVKIREHNASELFMGQFALIDQEKSGSISQFQFFRVCKYFGVRVPPSVFQRYAVDGHVSEDQFRLFVKEYVADRVKHRRSRSQDLVEMHSQLAPQLPTLQVMPIEEPPMQDRLDEGLEGEVEILETSIVRGELSATLAFSDKSADIAAYRVSVADQTVRVPANKQSPMTTVAISGMGGMKEASYLRVTAETDTGVHSEETCVAVFPPSCNAISVALPGIAKDQVTSKLIDAMSDAIQRRIGDQAVKVDPVCVRTNKDGVEVEFEVDGNCLQGPAANAAAVKPLLHQSDQLLNDLTQRHNCTFLKSLAVLRSNEVGYSRVGRLEVSVGEINKLAPTAKSARLRFTVGDKTHLSDAFPVRDGVAQCPETFIFDVESEKELKVELEVDGNADESYIKLLRDLEPGLNNPIVETRLGDVALKSQWRPRPHLVGEPSRKAAPTPVARRRTSSTQQKPARTEVKKTKTGEVTRMPLIVEAGHYFIGGKKVYLRVVGKQIMVRTGGGWQELRQWLMNSFGADSNVDLSDVFKVPKDHEQKKGLTVKDIATVDAVFAVDKRAGPGKRVQAKQTGYGKL